MFARLEEPKLWLIQTPSSKARMEDSILHSGFEVGKFEAENYAELERLRQRREELTILFSALALGSIAGLALFSLVLIAGLPIAAIAGELQKTSQRFLFMSELVEAFESEDISIKVGLKGEGIREIDFFLIFPDKEFILIQIRSLSFSKIAYKEERQALRITRKKKKGGVTTWKPDPLLELLDQERWLRKERPDLLGGSSRDRRRPIAKLLILWDDTVLGEHPEHLYATMNDQKFLMIRNKGTVFIVEREQVIDFIQGYLDSRRSPKTP
ncbi:MAG: hypothetical protein HC895_01415 [Leptolyngbyaceae cyanobacterium SM1_3_5]|nr:hypothetical protein [Leptolyngbyaceae cyanobacterium SM1_3_5]